MKSAKLISSALAMLFCIVTMAQQKTITGTVTDGALPLAGVNVKNKNGGGVSTDYNGKYSIKAKQGDILTFSYLGYDSKVITVNKDTIINVKLSQSTQTLNDVVIVGGMGIKKKKGVFTSTQQVVKSKELSHAANTNAIQTMKGKVSGLQVETVTNGTNPNATVTLRGNRTIPNNNNALVVIDGKISTSDELSNLPPQNISSVNVLKGANGTSLYGSQGANGVIVVETKDKKDVDDNNKNITPQKIEIDQEEYDNFIENAFESPKTAPLSTFSIDVDNASYTNVRRFINNGQTVPKDAVRVEEMINFFRYNYPQPTNEHPFSISTHYAQCPWNTENKLLKIGLQGKNIETDNLPASNIVFLIDVSGSMDQENKLPLVKASLKALTNQLRKEDKIAIVVYAGAAGLVLPSTLGNNKTTITDALERLSAGGSTAGGAGIELAYKVAEENFIKGGNNRVVLATDGDFNVGASSDSDMQTLIEEKRKSGVFLTCLGYGMGNYKDSKLETLADKGNGNYAYIDTMQEANRFLVKEFKGSMYAIAKDVKIQIEFNPSLVKAYRLIGYENRKLRPEDFQNDAIDAGEMGAGHSVTALYEIIPVNTASEFYIEPTDLKYTKTQKVENKFNNELGTIKFRYKKPDGNKSIELVQVIGNQLSSEISSNPDFAFCTAVAWFGLKLRNSKLITNTTTQNIIDLAKNGLSNDEEGYRAEFIRLANAVK